MRTIRILFSYSVAVVTLIFFGSMILYLPDPTSGLDDTKAAISESSTNTRSITSCSDPSSMDNDSLQWKEDGRRGASGAQLKSGKGKSS